jgi:N-glycosylase/DNA lyase
VEELDLVKEVYESNKHLIKAFLERTKDRSDEYLIAELMFCLQTSQSKAKSARNTINKLKEADKLLTADENEIRSVMEGVRFANKKSRYLFESRAKVEEIRKRLDLSPQELRDWLVENVNGMGMKLASHFLRNIGVFGLAILDVHVQNFMKRQGLLSGEVGKLSRREYLENEQHYLELAKLLGIPPEELDIAIWLFGNRAGVFYG